MFRVKHALVMLGCAFGMLVGLNSLFSDEPESTESKSEAASGDVRGLPSVTGQRAETAVQVMKLAGYEPAVGVFYITPQNWRDDIRPGVVYLQAPKAGVPYLSGASVGLWTFRKGKADQTAVSVPSVVGLEYDAAEKCLQEAGLKSMLEFRQSEVVRSGLARALVKEQYPSPEQMVLAGNSIYLLLRYSAVPEEAKSPRNGGSAK